MANDMFDTTTHTSGSSDTDSVAGIGNATTIRNGVPSSSSAYKNNTTTTTTTIPTKRRRNHPSSSNTSRSHSKNHRRSKSSASSRSGMKTNTIVGIVFLWGLVVFLYRYYHQHNHHMQLRWKETLLNRAKHILAQRRQQQPNTKNNHVEKDEEGTTTGGRKSDDGNQQQQEEEDEEGNVEKTKKKDSTSEGRESQQRYLNKRQQEEAETDKLRQLFLDLDRDMRENTHGGIRWTPDHLLRELPGQKPNLLLAQSDTVGSIRKKLKKNFKTAGFDFGIKRKNDPPMAWEGEWNLLPNDVKNQGPKVDYTKHNYTYPTIQSPPLEGYPELEPMGDLLARWPQDAVDDPPSPIVEKLMRFDYSDPHQREMAEVYRNAELPFKVYNIPEVTAAATKWTDEYVSAHFDGKSSFFSPENLSHGMCQESHDNFFAFFTPMGWQMSKMGPPPFRNNDWTFRKWSTHATYADATRLSFDQPHFYWQAGVPREERYASPTEWGFISRDLPMFSDTKANFFQFRPEEQKGIQCRFGERGVTAATHYDSGRNMIAMVQGAKRYILSPPRECHKLGIVTAKANTLYRHSLLNFGHIYYLDTEEGKNMPAQERGWLEQSQTALAIDTVLKAGEVLYVPSHWFHYITSLQKSAQCNVRSGIDVVGTRKFGGAQDVADCVA